MGGAGGVGIVQSAPQTISDPPTQAQVHAVNDELVAAITPLNEIGAALVDKGVVKGGA